MNDHGVLLANAAAIGTLAAKYQIPSIGPLELVRNVGLMGYGVNFPAIFRRAPYFVDRILKGTKPGDIPIEQATKFGAVINLRTARALGLTVAPTLLATADEVIE
jgi:putative ABC transport system substrate-binding protein